MDIVIGATQRISDPGKKIEPGGNLVEAKVLNVRAPRRQRSGPGAGRAERRNSQPTYDPASGRVLVLLVPEGYHIPADLDSGNYRVFLRITSRRK
jgi:hypothetical protein